MMIKSLLWSTGAILMVVLSALMVAAHHLRAGNVLLFGVYFALPLALLIPRSWAARTVQIALILGALEWLRIIPGLVETRQAYGLPWLRMIVILGSVALFTTLSVAAFRLHPLQRRYHLISPSPSAR